MSKGLSAEAAIAAVAELPNGDRETGKRMIALAKHYATDTADGYATSPKGGIAVTYHPGTGLWDVEGFTVPAEWQ
jgi:hypothetical protein